MFREGIIELGQLLKNLLAIVHFGIKTGSLKRAIMLAARLARRVNHVIENEILSKDAQPLGRHLQFGYSNKELAKLTSRCQGLHDLLRLARPAISFSVLVAVDQTPLRFFKSSLLSILNQTSSNFEIHVGFSGDHAAEYFELVDGLVKTHHNGHRITSYTFIANPCATTNALASRATGDFILPCAPDGWLRPDLLYRYELALALDSKASITVLSCDQYQVDHLDHPMLKGRIENSNTTFFPFKFYRSSQQTLCVPQELWRKVGGYDCSVSGAEQFDLCLRLNEANAEFRNLPFFLSAFRSERNDAVTHTVDHGALALRRYFQNRQLKWEVSPGLKPEFYRVRPSVQLNSFSIHVIVPFKDNRKMTLECYAHLQHQTWSNLCVTFIDNGSADSEIGASLEAKGAEVIRIEEPFNYSRLNNLGVAQSRFALSTNSILFLNNDVFLNETAVEEMAAWVFQLNVGIVGARLHYEDGTLQHGGIKLGHESNRHISWMHEEIGATYEESHKSLLIRTCEAVTGACLLIRKDVFLRVGSYDEVWYPISFSDTDLCRKVRREGYQILYTPYALGTHLESKSRGISYIEDFESSAWLFWHTERRGSPANVRLSHSHLDVSEIFRTPD